MSTNQHITLDHGAGGTAMRALIRDRIAARYGNDELKSLKDGAQLPYDDRSFVFTTDSYVIQPMFFPGGDIGKLAICGTVNDLLVMGARPRWLSVGMILEEGLPIDTLTRLCDSIAQTASAAGVEIVTGDTKVVPRGGCDGIYINTSGIGTQPFGKGMCADPVSAGDVILVSGTLGDHAIAVLGERLMLDFRTDVESDCAPLTEMIGNVLSKHSGVKWMRDLTRGGLAASVDEFSAAFACRVIVRENALPVSSTVRAVCDLLGYDPVHLANEGKVMMVVSRDQADDIIETMRFTHHGQFAASIGEIKAMTEVSVVVETNAGGLRRLQRPTGELLPRIC